MKYLIIFLFVIASCNDTNISTQKKSDVSESNNFSKQILMSFKENSFENYSKNLPSEEDFVPFMVKTHDFDASTATDKAEITNAFTFFTNQAKISFSKANNLLTNKSFNWEALKINNSEWNEQQNNLVIDFEDDKNTYIYDIKSCTKVNEKLYIGNVSSLRVK